MKIPSLPRSPFPVPFHKGFTLVELLVVIGIIGVLVGVLLSTFGGSTESARAAQCLANMKNLANACQTYGAANNKYPPSRSSEVFSVSMGDGGHVSRSYNEKKGWISWFSKGNYPATSSQDNPTIGFRTSKDEESMYALTNGCIWIYVARNRSTFVCPSHLKKKVKGTKSPPTWSYLMNPTVAGSNFGELARADRYLLFSEIPFQSWHRWMPDGTGTSTDDDGELQYKGATSGSGDKGQQASAAGKETIGANHVVGKNLFAHVAFADGHCEKLRIPYTGSAKNPTISESQIDDLTEWLCKGLDISFDGKQYQKLDN